MLGKKNNSDENEGYCIEDHYMTCNRVRGNCRIWILKKDVRCLWKTTIKKEYMDGKEYVNCEKE